MRVVIIDDKADMQKSVSAFFFLKSCKMLILMEGENHETNTLSKRHQWKTLWQAVM